MMSRPGSAFRPEAAHTNRRAAIHAAYSLAADEGHKNWLEKA